MHVEGVEIPVHHGFVEKGHHLEELEVADFVAHAAGGQAMRRLRGESGFRKDFQAVFQANEIWTSFIAVQRAEEQNDDENKGELQWPPIG